MSEMSAEISTSARYPRSFPRTGKKSTIFSHSELRQYFPTRSFLPQRYISRLDGNKDREVKYHFWDAHGRVKVDSEVPLTMWGVSFLSSEKMQNHEKCSKNSFSNIVTECFQDVPLTFTDPNNAPKHTWEPWEHSQVR